MCFELVVLLPFMLPQERRSKPKLRKKTTFSSDYGHLLILELAVVVLLVLLSVFYFVSGKLLKKNFPSDARSLSSNYWVSDIVESINYHGYQLPADFPKILLRGQVGDLISSQEFRQPNMGSLKYVSYSSSLPVAEILAFYESYLDRSAYQVISAASGQPVDELFAQRSSMSYSVSVRPAQSGSVVGITYRALRQD